jgi:hypothetical protein
MSNNRLGPGNNNPNEQPKPPSKEEIEKAYNAILHHGMLIHNLLSPGCSVVIEVEEKPKVIAPGRKPTKHHLIITRPLVKLSLKSQT